MTLTYQQTDQDYKTNCQHVLNHIEETSDILNEMERMDTDMSCCSELHVLQQQQQQQTHGAQTSTLQTCLNHLSNLKKRVSDPLSKVLVTGDLNSGKSTLVNALLNKDILPVDQQPCTSTFCQVYSSPADTTKDDDEIHAVVDADKYDKTNKETYHPIEPRHLYKTLVDEDMPYKIVNIYTAHNQHALNQHSLLHNDLVNVALIDSPGLNTDSLKTTSVFARQEEIDVVVFVVSAENHFTLSGKEFLMNAAQEKKHMFIVVNRFDNIRDKERCKRLILQQIELVSPSTFAQANELVHFVSAAHHKDDPDFANLEQSLRSFVLFNRSVSKLVPAKHYLQNVLQDVHVLATANQDTSRDRLQEVVQHLESQFLPDMRDLEKAADAVQDSIQQLSKSTLQNIESDTSKSITSATSDEALDECIASVTFPGIHLSWQYAQNIAGALASHVESQLGQIEEQATQDTTECMDKMNQLVVDQLGKWNDNITTDVLSSSAHSKHQRIHINVQARDFLMERRFVNDKKVALVGLGTTSATVMLFKWISIKDMALNFLHRYLNPLLDDPTANMPSRRIMVNCITAVSLIGIGWTAYSFISSIPAALRANLKIKFQRAVENEKLQENTTHRITHGVHNLLESKHTEITSRVQQLLEEKSQEKEQLEARVSEAKSILEQYDSLAFRSNALLVKVKASLHENLVE
ncbi:hypothetical protein HMPREF1544_06561 [Mucor circinelloides 1006PhL]|uniref:Dynamin-type G domain-containing protein n=1 Tax=Mucor circinelloides f. circinelloides (strain 1006PhL) TaxID=1220926 RepID=S2J961_MUCC1|nr:hypothetical protein HMPREF1544_06561 [Mucor circinelloides 1006PhL]